MISQFHFDSQMKRLEETFGDRHFGENRTKRIWEIVKHMNSEWLQGFIDEVIDKKRQAPLPIDFMDAVGEERQKLKPCEFDIINAHPSDDSVFSKSELQEIMKFVSDAAAGRRTKEQCDQYIDILQQAIRSRNTCLDCEGTGLAFKFMDGSRYVFKCGCSLSETKKENFPRINAR